MIEVGCFVAGLLSGWLVMTIVHGVRQPIFPDWRRPMLPENDDHE